MAEIKDIWEKSLPNFGYVIEMNDGSQSVFILGSKPNEQEAENYAQKPNILREFNRMISIYQQPSWSEDDKKTLAKQVKKMRSICEARVKGAYTETEQMEAISELSDEEKKQLRYQIQMYMDCCEFYKEFYL